MPFQPFRDYTGFNHVLMAGGVWVHPGNGNIYACACEQRSGVQQDLAVYRLAAGTTVWEEVKRYAGTVASAAQVTFGSAAIGQGGALFVATSLIIPGAAKMTTTGFQGCWIREPNIDAPWSVVGATDPALRTTIETLQIIVQSQAQQLTAIEAALGTIGSGVLSDADVQALAWLHDLRSLLRVA